MKYSMENPIAVFLGPSLPHAEATRYLAANYYPPVRMGDIYRLIGTGLRAIILIDGVFYGAISVWHREILAALQAGICIVGAASMGALRAAELHQFGMIGSGQIFAWYRDGFLEGDDEVALLHHEDPDLAFQPLTEPLVNIRYNLIQAEEQGVISQSRRIEFLKCAQNIHFTQRTLKGLLQHSNLKSWPVEEYERITSYFTHHYVNLKRADAIEVLQKYPQLLLQSPLRKSDPHHLHFSHLYASIEIFERGALTSGGQLVAHREWFPLLDEALSFRKQHLPQLIQLFFIEKWADAYSIECPISESQVYLARWINEQRIKDLRSWLISNGLTYQEFQREIQLRALIDWILTSLEHTPTCFGARLVRHLQVILAIQAEHKYTCRSISPEFSERVMISYTIIADWAQKEGISCPQSNVVRFIEQLEMQWQPGMRNCILARANVTEDTYLNSVSTWATAQWIVNQQPRYFGYLTWSPEAALIRDLQLTGEVAQLISRGL